MIKTVLKHKRINGFRKMGGVYLICDDITNYECKNTPLPLSHFCPTCGTELNHKHPSLPVDTSQLIRCQRKGYSCECPICVPSKKGLLYWINGEIPVEEFKNDFSRHGISLYLKGTAGRVKPGDIVYIAHRKGINRMAISPKLENILYSYVPEHVRKEYLQETEISEANRPAVVMVGKIREIQKIVSLEAAKDQVYLERLEDKGLTPVLEVEWKNDSLEAFLEPLRGINGGSVLLEVGA